MTEGQVAGRLEVIVEAELRGWGKRLKKKVEAATEGIEAKVAVTPDTKGFKAKLEKQVKKAARGVEAKISANVDASTLKAKMEAAAQVAATSINVEVDADRLVKDTVKAGAQAEAAANANPIRVWLRTKGNLVTQALAERFKAQRVVDANPINVPVGMKGRFFRKREWTTAGENGATAFNEAWTRVGSPFGRRFRLRGWLRGGIMVGLLAMIQPAVGAITGVLGGLTAMAGAIAPAAGALAAIPLGLSAAVQGMVGLTLAAGGVGDAFTLLNQKQQALADGTEWTADQQAKLDAALNKIAPSARRFVRRVTEVKDEWAGLRREVQEPLFAALARQVKPITTALLPTLKAGLRGTGEALGVVVDRWAEWLTMDRTARNIGGVMEQNNRTIEAGGTAMRFLLDGWLEFQRAAEPFQRQMDGWMTRSAKWFRDTMRENRKDGSTAAFLDKAVERLSLVWDITKQVGSGLAGIFRAGDASGMRLLTTLQEVVTGWSKWVNSDPGQARISRWFESVEGITREAGRMLDDTFTAILKWAEDPKIERMLRMIRTELGPALNDFLTALSDMMGENVVDFFTELTRALNNLEPMLTVISDLTGLLIDLVGTMNDVVEASGGFGDALLTIAGGMLVWGKAKKLLGVGAAGAAGGGLLASLLGNASKGKHAAGAAGAAKAMGDAASKGGKLGGVMSKLTKSPLLKKAGWAGLIISAIDVADHLQSVGYNAEDSGQEAGDAVNNLTTRIAAARKSLDRSTVGKYADDWGLNLDKLARSIATNGKHVKREIDRLENEYLGKRWELPGEMLPWVDNYKGNRLMREDLQQLLDSYREAAEKSREARKYARDYARNSRWIGQMIRKFPANPPPTGMLLDPDAWVEPYESFFDAVDRGIRATVREARRKRDALLAEINRWKTPKLLRGPENPIPDSLQRPEGMPRPKPIKPKAPKIDLSNYEASMERAKTKTQKLFDQLLGPKGSLYPTSGPFAGGGRGMPGTGKFVLPPVNAKPLTSSVTTATQGVKKKLNSLGKTGSKRVRLPRADTKPLTQSVQRGVRQVLVQTRRLTKMRPIKLPKLNTRPITEPMQQIVKVVRQSTNQAQKIATQGGQQIVKAFRQAGNQSQKAMTAGMTAVVKAVQSKGKAAVAAANNTKQGIVSAFSGMSGPLFSAGINAMQGLVNGINSRGAAAVAAARRIAAQVAAASRAELDIRSPSRVMMRIGRFVSEGFAKGITGGAKAVDRARRKVMGLLTDKGWGKRERRKFAKASAAEFRDLEKLARRIETIANRVERGKGRVTKALFGNSKKERKKQREYTRDLKQNAVDYGSLTNISDYAGGYLTPKFAISELRRRAKSAKEFTRNLRELRLKGLGNKAYKQLLEAGAEDAGHIAEQLTKATPKQIKAINRLQSKIVGAARKMGADTGRKFRRVGRDAGKGLVRGLIDNKPLLTKAARDMATAFTRQIKRTLKIKSPSRVMYGIGGDTIDGLRGGVNHHAERLMADARRLSEQLAQDLGPNTYAKSLYRDASHASRKLMDVRMPAALAPLVGELVIQGKSREEIRDGFEEAMFALRQIRNGGVYADRTAR